MSIKFKQFGEVPGNGTTDAAVAAAVFNNSLYLFAKGIDNKCIYLNKSADGNNWSGWKEVPGNGTTDVAVAAAVFNNSLYLFAKGIDNKRIYLNKSADGNNWSGWKELSGNGTTDAAVAAAVFNNSLYLFAKGIDNKRIYLNKNADGNNWSGWKEVPGNGTTDVAVAAVVSRDSTFNVDTLSLFAKGIDDKEIYRNQSQDGKAWWGWTEYDHSTGTKKFVTNVPVATVFRSDIVHVFAVHTNQHIYYSSYWTVSPK